MEDLIGKQLDEYQVVEEIGRGGMAVVYKGYQASLKRYVAIKVLKEHLSDDRALVERFQREARAAARLRHPNIIHIYTVGREGNRYYIVMDYVEGPSLAAKLREDGALSPREALSILRQVGSALDHAHAQGVVHRDVKPSNILLTQDGQATLSDFGIAQAADESRLTRTGTVMGTAEYMSPEQAEGRDADARSDLYSLGVVLYEMLTGRVPFTAETTAAVLYKQVHDAPTAPSRLNSSVPAAVDRVVLRALHKNRGKRYASAREMERALAAALRLVGGLGSRIDVPGPRARAPLIAAVLLIGISAIGLAAILSGRGQPPAGPVRPQATFTSAAQAHTATPYSTHTLAAAFTQILQPSRTPLSAQPTPTTLPSVRFKVNQIVRVQDWVTYGVFLREQPDQYLEAGAVIAMLPAGTELRVVGAEPIQAYLSGTREWHTYWHVRTLGDTSVEGWITEIGIEPAVE